jgi:beta-lactamase regulating signal transducer with metallopeptidase domain
VLGSLLDHLWQSTVFACGAGLLTLLFRHNGAHTRYWLWLAASVKFLVPFSALLAVGRELARHATAPMAVVPIPHLAQQLTVPFSGSTALAVPASRGASGESVLLILWALGTLAILLLWLVRWSRMNTIVRSATPLAMDLPIPVHCAQSLLEPGLVGIWRPVLLLPEGLTTRLSEQETGSVLAHELCHLRRRDNLTASIHMLVEALFWFHPLTWWLGARLIAERERACDEAVLESGNDAEVYAEGILKVCRFYVGSPLVSAAGVSRANLRRRIEEIMHARQALPLDTLRKLLLGVASGAAVAVPLLFGLLTAPASSARVAEPASLVDQMAQRRYEQSRPRTAVPFEANHFDRFVGVYQVNPEMFSRVFRSGGRYFASLTGQPTVEIFPESESKFFFKVEPAQLSVVTDAHGRVTRLVVHQNGLEYPAMKVDESIARDAEAELQLRIRNKTPGPGTEAWIRRDIDSMIKGEPNYEEMTPSLAAALRARPAQSVEFIQSLGRFESLAFQGVGPDGTDVYHATFANALVEYRLPPLNAQGKATGLAVHALP